MAELMRHHPATEPAGEALDRMVAVHVVGYRRGQDLFDGLAVRPQFIAPGADPRDESPMVPGYSRSIAFAWDALEALHADGWQVLVGPTDAGYRCMAHRDAGDVEGVGATAALAIARCCVLAACSGTPTNPPPAGISRRERPTGGR
jgi:hypothetical protein